MAEPPRPHPVCLLLFNSQRKTIRTPKETYKSSTISSNQEGSPSVEVHVAVMFHKCAPGGGDSTLVMGGIISEAVLMDSELPAGLLRSLLRSYICSLLLLNSVLNFSFSTLPTEGVHARVHVCAPLLPEQVELRDCPVSHRFNKTWKMEAG